MRCLSYLFFLSLLAACNNSSVGVNKEDSANASTPGEVGELQGTGINLLKGKNDFYVWEIDMDKKTLRKNPLLSSPALGVDTLIMGLNERYPKILLEKQRISNDTLYTEIKDADFLTDQMGSYGAEQYIANAVLNLTAAPGIRYVRINFVEGSHAGPDVWSKESFAGFKTIE